MYVVLLYKNKANHTQVIMLFWRENSHQTNSMISKIKQNTEHS